MAEFTMPFISWIDLLLERIPPLPVRWDALDGIVDTHQGATQEFYSEKTTFETVSFVNKDKINEFRRYLYSADDLVAQVPLYDAPLANEQAVVENSYSSTLLPVATAANSMVADTVFAKAKYNHNDKDNISLKRARCVLLKILEYRVTIRCPKVGNMRHIYATLTILGDEPYYLDHFIAFEPSVTIVDDHAVVMDKISSLKPTPKSQERWCDAAQFSDKLNKLAQELFIKQKQALKKGLLTPEYEYSLAIKIAQENVTALPRMSLLVQEEKKPSTIDIDTWMNAQMYNDRSCWGNKALRNLRKIDAQVRTYSVITHCPWVVATEYNQYVLMKVVKAGIRMDAISGDLSRDTEYGRIEMDRNEHGLSLRSLVIYPIIQQLRNAGLFTAEDLAVDN